MFEEIDNRADVYMAHLVYDRQALGEEIPSWVQYLIRNAYVAGAVSSMKDDPVITDK